MNFGKGPVDVEIARYVYSVAVMVLGSAIKELRALPTVLDSG